MLLLIYFIFIFPFMAFLARAYGIRSTSSLYLIAFLGILWPLSATVLFIDFLAFLVFGIEPSLCSHKIKQMYCERFGHDYWPIATMADGTYHLQCRRCGKTAIIKSDD